VGRKKPRKGRAALRREYRRLSEVELREALDAGEDPLVALAEFYADLREDEDLEEEGEEEW
jgi:hypothetical protein